MSADILFKEFEGQKAIRIIKPSAVHIESGWKMLTDTASITLPRNVKDFDKLKVKEIFKVGRPVEIKLGYNGENVTEFTGYITKTSADIPVKIELQDEMWQLKQMPAHISTRSIKLGDFIKQLLPGYEIEVEEWEMPPQRHTRTTVAKVLDYLKQQYKLYSYFVPGTKKLIVGKIYADDADKEPVKVHLETNARANDLQYKDKDDIRIKIRAISTLRNGSKLEAVVGDEDGTEQQLAYYGIEVQAELEKAAERDYRQKKVSGFDGSLTLFGQPFLTHGNKVELSSDVYPDRDGTYYVDKVSVDYGTGGYKRKLELGDKL